MNLQCRSQFHRLCLGKELFIYVHIYEERFSKTQCLNLTLPLQFHFLEWHLSSFGKELFKYICSNNSRFTWWWLQVNTNLYNLIEDGATCFLTCVYAFTPDTTPVYTSSMATLLPSNFPFPELLWTKDAIYSELTEHFGSTVKGM